MQSGEKEGAGDVVASQAKSSLSRLVMAFCPFGAVVESVSCVRIMRGWKGQGFVRYGRRGMSRGGDG